MAIRPNIKKHEQDKSASLKKPLWGTILLKLRSERSKRIIIHHLLPILFFLLIAISIFRKIIGVEGEFINGDLVKPPELEQFFKFYYPMWSEYESISVISRLPQLFFYLPFFGIGYLFNLDTCDVLLLIFIFVEFFAGITMYYASRYLLQKTYKNDDNKIILASFTAGFAYLWSTYLIFHSFHPTIRVAFAFAPLILLCLLVGLEKRKLKYMILTAFLWCVVCADVHWVVYGAVLISCLFIYHFFLEFATNYHNGKFKAFKNSFIFHAKYLIALIASFFGFISYWFIPGYLMGGSSRYSVLLTQEQLENFYSLATMVDMMRKQGEHYFARIMFESNSELLMTPFFQNATILLSFGVFIFAMIALILKPKNRYVLFFSGFAVLILFISTSITFVPEFGFWLINDAPLHEFYGWAFRTPKISQFLILSFSLLIGFTIVETLKRLEKSSIKSTNLKKFAACLIFVILFLSIILPNWPLATGDVNTLLTPSEMPDEFAQTNSWLEEQEGDFKVLWLPKYNSRNVNWNEGHRTAKNIAGFASSKPTYVFDTLTMQPNGYGVYFLAATTDVYPYSMLHNNMTENLGKFFAPLGIKYIIFHDDNANWVPQTEAMRENLKYQDDLELVQQFGFISVYENKYQDTQESSHFFTTSNNYLVSGGLNALATLNAIPYFQSREDGVLFCNQRFYSEDDLNEMIDHVVFTKSEGLEEIAINFAEDEYFIAPFEYTERHEPQNIWSKIRLIDFGWHRIQDRGKANEWGWGYDSGIVYTWSPGSVEDDLSLSDQDLIKQYDFETGFNGFNSLFPNLKLFQSSNSVEGAKSLMGKLEGGEPELNYIASNKLTPLTSESAYLQISMYYAAQNAVNFQVIIKYYDENSKYLKREFLITKSGDFEFTKLEAEIHPPIDAKYFNIQILADQKKNTVSFWWVDDIRIYDLKRFMIPNMLEMDFKVDNTDGYDIFLRCLKGAAGGKIGIHLDGSEIDTIETLGKPNAFDWMRVVPVQIRKGSHTLSIENINGFNAVNLIAIIPANKTLEYFERTEGLLDNKGLTYIFEAESDFEFENAKVTQTYGCAASSNGVLNLDNRGTAILPLEILRSGNYSISMRLAEGSENNNLDISIGNNFYILEHNGTPGFSWRNIDNIPLEKGIQNLRLTSTQREKVLLELSFEDGWNSTLQAPSFWVPPRAQFNAALDNYSLTKGEYSLKLTTNTTDPDMYSWMRSRDIILKPDSFYEVTMDLKIDNVRDSQVKISGFNVSTGEWEEVADLVSFLRGTRDWTKYNNTFYISEDISKIGLVLNAGPVLNPDAGEATMWFDNIKISKFVETRNNEIDLVALYRNEDNQTLETIFEPHQVAIVVEYDMLETTKYRLRINSEAPFMLGFAEAYDQFWVAKLDGQDTDTDAVDSVPLYGMINGFYINKTGNFTLTIEFKPQEWFETGMKITGFTLVCSFGYFIWTERKRWGKRFGILSKKENNLAAKTGRKQK